MELYDYQKQYIAKMRASISQGNNRLILCAPTGCGKTIMFSYMVSRHILKGGKALVLTHRAELLTQAGGAFEKFGIMPEYITAKTQNITVLGGSAYVGMVETINNRDIDLSVFSLVIIDEAHLENFTKIFDRISPDAVVIGATATPQRKGKQASLDEFYTDLIQVVDTPELIQLGKLSAAQSYGIPFDTKGMKRTANDFDTAAFYEENKIYEGVINNYRIYGNNQKTILFASNVESSKRVCYEFQVNEYNARHVDGKMNPKQRAEIFEWFDNTPDAILCNCGIATTGFDQPDIHNVILYRATTSLPLFLQMCGRGSRVAPDKPHFNIFDFGGNIKRFGFWETPRKWSLKKPEKKKEQAAPVKECPQCCYINYASASVCQNCGLEFPKPEKTPEEVILQKLSSIPKGKRVSDLSLQDLLVLQKSGRLKAPFVWRVVRSRGVDTIKFYAKIAGYKNGWIHRQAQEMNNTDFKDVTI
jgi:superfamily II DNA or RNA helicase